MRRTSEQGLRKKLQDYSYLLSQHIGKGYSSHVYKGRHDLTDETVAIKVIDMKKINNEVHKNLLASEIEVLKLLKNSDHILELHEIFTTKNNTYIITEMCEGGDLSKHISARRNISEREAIPLMNQIIKGYNNMQERGIIHRDLKPANIFMKNNTMKIADFGFAMKENNSKKYSSYNVGSPVYMPPEALNDNKYSFKSDIWALGVIYYEMLTGKTPWRAKTEKELGRLLLSVPIRKVMPPSISASSQNFLKRTLTVDAHSRMDPEELQTFVLTQDKMNIPRPLYSTEHDLLETRNNKIRRSDRHETSLGKPLNTPSTFKRLNMLQTKDSFNTTKFTLPKTAATVANKTEHHIPALPSSNKTITNPFNQQQARTHHQIGEGTEVDKKYLSKQLLSQIHLCRFIYKLLMRMHERLGEYLNDELLTLKEEMAGMIFDKLHAVQELRMLPSEQVEEFRGSNQFKKIKQIIGQYMVKYRKDLGQYRQLLKSLPTFKEQLTSNIVKIYRKVQENEEQDDQWKELVIVLDYLVTLRQLVGLMFNNDIEGFHIKSKIQTIVQGNPSKNISQDHLAAIAHKLRAIKII